MKFNSTFESRFWAKVKKTHKCWLWTASLSAGRYGNIGLGGRGRMVKAHRASWVLHFGEIPKGMNVLHRCDNTICVRPDHLFLGTQAQNIADMDRKGRRRPSRGERFPQSKLTEKSVRKIRDMYIPGQVRQVDLAKMFGVSHVVIGKVIRKQAWKHV